jgi:hypothetical protein
MVMGAGSNPGEVQGSAIHRRRWSGIPGGEREARHRGGFPSIRANTPGSAGDDLTEVELEDSLQQGLEDLRPLFRDMDAPSTPDADHMPTADGEPGAATQLDDGGALEEPLSGESMDVVVNEEVVEAAGKAQEGGDGVVAQLASESMHPVEDTGARGSGDEDMGGERAVLSSEL